MINGIINH